LNQREGSSASSEANKPTQEPADWQLHGSTAQKVSAVVSALALLAAIAGFYIASSQLREVRESSAKRLFGDYLRLSVEKPDLSDPLDYVAIRRDKFTAYQSFVWSALYACDEIAPLLFHDKGWRVGCGDHLRRHVRYLCEGGDTLAQTYSAPLRDLINELRREAKGKFPEC